MSPDLGKSRWEEPEQTATPQKNLHSSTPRRRWLLVSYPNDGNPSKNNNNSDYDPTRSSSTKSSASQLVPLNTHTRISHSKAERANALADLAKRRRDIAARRGYGKVESSRALILAGHRTIESSRALILADHRNIESSRGLIQADHSDEANTSFEEIKKITIGQSTLEKWYTKPFFDELIAGCFVRLGIGEAHFAVPVYRLCMVRNMDDTKSDCHYRFDNKDTCKYLNLVWGNDNSTARWKMTRVMDSPPLKEEFDQLVKEAKRVGGYMPMKNEVFEKIESIRKVNSSIYSAVAVPGHMNIKNEKAVKVAELNRKNKIENFKNASSKRKCVDTSLENGDSGYDPFSRRWTKSRNYYAIISSGGDDGEGRGETNYSDALGKAAGGGELVDTSAPIDHGNESNKFHDFEMCISLVALERFGGPRGVRAGFMANKGRIESAVGCKVPMDDPTKHTCAMSVDEYKKRRGMI